MAGLSNSEGFLMPAERIERNTGRWAKRVGAGAFLFFFLKGMLWLMIPVVAVVIEGCGAEGA
ncbi:MAG: hypothetical protein KDA32_07780 [Phycisphaerales bacterium]|nr:hypothetical protein [Phycisphaerales bacterium]